MLEHRLCLLRRSVDNVWAILPQRASADIATANHPSADHAAADHPTHHAAADGPTANLTTADPGDLRTDRSCPQHPEPPGLLPGCWFLRVIHGVAHTRLHLPAGLHEFRA